MTLYCFSRGKRLTNLFTPKINYAQDIVFEKDVSISGTEINDLVYLLRGVVDLHETEMMQIRLKQWAQSKWIFSSYPVDNNKALLLPKRDKIMHVSLRFPL